MAYVSKELTHFVAWNKETLEEQYEVLAKILQMGWLTTTPDAPGSPKGLDVLPGNKISNNRMYHSGAICFCDIPVEDFRIHIAKYSPFGLAFTKTFLLQKGANPIFYIANDSVYGTHRLTGQTVTRGDFFDSMSKGIWHRFADGVQLLQNRPDLDPEVRQHLERFQQIDALCVHLLLAYMKLFDVGQDDAAADNFYMEREWRTPVDVQFTLSDVCRIILPKDWETRFRSDFPEYAGELTHAPQGVARVPRTVHPRYYPGEVGLTMKIQLARVDSDEKSKATAWFGPMDDPESGVEVPLEEMPSEPTPEKE